MTIYDIAKEANVSIATVSRVLNGSNTVSPKTREKVAQAMKKLNYIPNPFARGLTLNTMRVIGVVCTDVGDAFYAKAVSILENALRSHNFDIVLCCTGNGSHPKQKYISDLKNKFVDAIIIIGSPLSSSEDIHYLKELSQTTSIITINSDYHLPQGYSITCNEEAGIFEVVQRLVAQGCQSIAYLYDSLTHSGHQKLNGYIKGITHCNLKQNPILIQQIDRSLEAASTAIEMLLQQQVPLDAIITSEDLLAVGAQRTILSHQQQFNQTTSIPVIGCNNSVLAECATPTLTSLDNQLDLLCQKAVELCVALLSGNTQSNQQTYRIDAKIQYRESFKI